MLVHQKELMKTIRMHKGYSHYHTVPLQKSGTFLTTLLPGSHQTMALLLACRIKYLYQIKQENQSFIEINQKIINFRNFNNHEETIVLNSRLITTKFSTKDLMKQFNFLPFVITIYSITQKDDRKFSNQMQRT